MSKFADKVSGLTRLVDVHLEELDMDVQVKKLSWGEIKDLQKWQKKNKIKKEDLNSLSLMVCYFLMNYFLDEDDEPLLSEGDNEIIEQLTAKSIAEISKAFNDINTPDQIDEEELKKK